MLTRTKWRNSNNSSTINYRYSVIFTINCNSYISSSINWYIHSNCSIFTSFNIIRNINSYIVFSILRHNTSRIRLRSILTITRISGCDIMITRTKWWDSYSCCTIIYRYSVIFTINCNCYVSSCITR